MTSEDHQVLATRFRKFLVRQKDMQLYLDLGEYRRGENTDNDAAFDRKDQMEAFLQQRMSEKTGMQACLEALYGSVA